MKNLEYPLESPSLLKWGQLFTQILDFFVRIRSHKFYNNIQGRCQFFFSDSLTRAHTHIDRVHLCSNEAGYLRKYLPFWLKFAHTNSINIQGRCQFFSRDSKTRAHTHIDKSSISRIYTSVDSYFLKYHKYTTIIYLKLCLPMKVFVNINYNV